jgi:DNA-binding NarL/FixJ family response regulator
VLGGTPDTYQKAGLRRGTATSKSTTAGTTSSDAYEGVAAALRTQPDVILLDYQLPRLTGSDAIPMFREAAPKCKVILYSAVFDLDGLPSDAPRPDAYLRKGVDPSFIVATARML